TALDRSGYAAHLHFLPGGEVAAANLRKIVRLADGHPEWSLRELSEHLER
ncbi:MAG: hypothetical protein GWN71_43425, partial [Gammaproteobacteria bacterium]|nr:hypothetical protein [Gemmatimonadota bacterium]NIU80143.1 hypothetical protein [Gammaproteobacteria bacterium]